MNFKILLWISVLAIGMAACQGEKKPGAAKAYTVEEGKTMGTYWRVTYDDSLGRAFQQPIEVLLDAVNLDISTYIENSTVSRFNRAADTIVLDEKNNEHFFRNFRMAQEAFQSSQGAFDITIMPLVNYWGFGYTGKKEVTAVDSTAIDSLIHLVGMKNVTLTAESGGKWVLRKSRPEVQLDFGGTGQGYGVDVISELLDKAGLTNYLVDVGGEQRSKGVSPRGDDWRIGINVPREGAAEDEIQTAIPLHNWSVSTSGNYRNFYEVNGVKYSHTINTKTGFPERNTLLSASVFATQCLHADAYATTFMALGVDKAFDLATQLPGIEAYFIYSRPDGQMAVRYTDGLKPLFDKN